ncbi:hypothetical protein [Kitasatospora griseola]|uniref:hypothetical protein n=1 Tax=Kitasatospora griseola TaxID=2064 RepID=UPI0037FE268C
MNGEEARVVIRSQAEAVRQRLQLLVRERGRQAEAQAAALRPWQRNTTTFTGRFRPEAIAALDEAESWLIGNRELPEYEFGGGLYYWLERRGITKSRLVPDTDSGGFKQYETFHLAENPRVNRANIVNEVRTSEFHIVTVRNVPAEVDFVLGMLDDMASWCRKGEVRGDLLTAPDSAPSRHGRLVPGVLARNFSADLGEAIAAGRRLDRELSANASSETLEAWLNATQELLRLLRPESIGSDFSGLSWVFPFHSFFPDHNALRRAYLALAIEYLGKVESHMPDYAEASGQGVPSVSMSITGGNFYGGQFAAQIANINSTIASVQHQGNPDMAQALQGLQQAVSSQPGLIDDQRQDLLDNVQYLAEAAQTPPDRRNRGIVRAALTALTVAAASGEHLQAALDAWGGVLNTLT